MEAKIWNPLHVKEKRVDPRTLKLLDLNARYMRHETYMRLVENIKKDGTLTSTPFCWLMRDETTQEPIVDETGNPVFEVLSGNHRTKAAIDAGLTEITIQVTEDYLSPERRAAIQLSHNAITGEDDPVILKVVYEGINDFDMRVYNGLDDKQLALVERVEIASLSEANLNFQTIALVFLPNEIEQAKATWAEAKRATASVKGAWVAPMATYDQAMDALEAVGLTYGVTNIASALMVVLDIFRRHILDVQDGLIGVEDEAPSRRRGLMPIDVILGDHYIRRDTAAKLKKVADRLVSEGKLDPQKRWQVIDYLLENER